MMNVVLDEGAKLPTKAHEEDAGWDLYAREDFKVPACSFQQCVSIDNDTLPWTEVTVGSATHDTGVHIEIPWGCAGFLKSKSGLNVKYGLTAEGVIDCGYTGSIVVKLYNHTACDYYFHKGDKITQLVILPIWTEEIVQADSFKYVDTARGNNGFGSSGRN